MTAMVGLVLAFALIGLGILAMISIIVSCAIAGYCDLRYLKMDADRMEESECSTE